MVRIILVAMCGALIFCPGALAGTDNLAQRAIRGDRAAIAVLRTRGPEGLKMVLDATGGRPSAAVDAVAGQKDAHASRLYWYTDLDKAKAAAARDNKPILSLRLLGRLDEELSCANSRFFRTTLYPDPAVSKLLREKFILHWSSERPAPVITIDFGDGRVMKRTITGNSIHYVLDEHGRPIDALPGLYSAEMFVRKLNAVLEFYPQLDGPDHSEKLAAWHRAAAEAKPETIKPVPLSPQVLQVIEAKEAPPAAPRAGRAAPLAETKVRVERPLLASIRPLEESIAQDTERNENDFHRQIHRWFADGQVADLTSFNDRVYAQLFLTPKADPWLGLAPVDVYSGIENGGLARR